MPFAVQHMNVSFEHQYRELVIINKDISKEDSVERIKSKYQFNQKHKLKLSINNSRGEYL